MSSETGSEPSGGNTRCFSDEARERLERKGFVIYELSGDKLEDITGNNFEIDFATGANRDIDHGMLADTRSYQGEVALRPQQMVDRLLHLRKFDDNDYINWGNRRVSKTVRNSVNKFPGTTVIEGNVATYAALAQVHYMETRKTIFNSDYNARGPYSHTDVALTTDTVKSGVVAVGIDYTVGKLMRMQVLKATRTPSNTHVKLLPLVVAR
jgi:hypothetical protein